MRERRRMAERQARLAFEMQDLAARELKRLMSLLEKGRSVRFLENGEWKERVDPVELSPAMIVKLIDAGSRLERTALGEPTEDHSAKIEVIVDIEDPLPEDQEALEEAIAA